MPDIKFPFDLISNLLTQLLDSKLSKLESKNKDEMNKIKSLSQNTKIIINELQHINKKIKPKQKPIKKSINLFNSLNLVHKNSNKTSSKYNITIPNKKLGHTPDRKCYSKIKTSNNNIKKLNLSKSYNFSNNDSLSNSKISNYLKRDCKLTKKSRSKNKKRDLTPMPSSPSSLFKKAIVKEKRKPKHYNNINSLKHSYTNTNFYKKVNNKSCKILPYIKKDKLNLTKISKNEELDALCAQMQDEDKRIYDLNPDLSKNILNRKEIENKKIRSLLVKGENSENDNKKEPLTLDDSLMNDVNNEDELLIYYHNKNEMRIINDKSILDDEPDYNLDFEINNIKNNNYTIAEIFDHCIEYLEQYLTKEDFLRMGLLNKECFKMIMHYLISKKENALDDIKEALSVLKNNNSDIFSKNDKINKFTIKPFEYDTNSNRAIKLLKTIKIVNIFHNKQLLELNNKYIILLFDLFFIALGYKKDILSFKNDIKSKWGFYTNFFGKDNNEYFGHPIENNLKGKIFDNDIINSLYEYSHNHINIIASTYFQSINKDIALFVFIVKNILEHLGITKELHNKKNNDKNVIKLYLLYNARISINSILIQKLIQINSIISS